METSWIVILSIAGVFGVAAAAFISTGLYLHYCGRSDVLSEELQNRVGELEQQRQKVCRKIEELKGKVDQLGEDCEVSDISWCLDDNHWRLQDIEWAIHDTKWEVRDRSHQRRNSVATFWTVLGAAAFALGGLVVSIGGVLAEKV